MRGYTVQFESRVEKDLRAIPLDIAERLIARAIALGEDPFAPGTVKLKGETSYRVRVGEYRIVFDVDTGAHLVSVLAVGHRGDIYRKR